MGISVLDVIGLIVRFVMRYYDDEPFSGISFVTDVNTGATTIGATTGGATTTIGATTDVTTGATILATTIITSPSLVLPPHIDKLFKEELHDKLAREKVLELSTEYIYAFKNGPCLSKEYLFFVYTYILNCTKRLTDIQDYMEAKVRMLLQKQPLIKEITELVDGVDGMFDSKFRRCVIVGEFNDFMVDVTNYDKRYKSVLAKSLHLVKFYTGYVIYNKCAVIKNITSRETCINDNL